MAAPLLRTPGGKTHEDINSYIIRVNRRGIILQTRDRDWSPKHANNNLKEEKCTELIKFLFFQAKATLDHVIEKFEKDAANFATSRLRLEHLLGLLEKTTHDARLVSSSGRKLPDSTEGFEHTDGDLEPPSSTTFRQKLQLQQERFGRKTTPVEEDEYDTEDGSFVTPPQSPTLVALSQHRELRSSRRTLQISESGSKGKRSIPEQDDQVQFPKYSRTSSGRRSRASTTASTAASTGSFHTFPVPETITGSLAIRSSGSPSRSFPQGISFTSTTKSTIPSFSSSVNQPYPQTQSGNTSFHTELTVPDLAEEVRSSHSFSLASSEENAVIGASSKAEKADQFETFSSGAVSWDSDFRDQVGLALDNFEKSEALPKTEASATLEATGTFARKFPEHHKVRDLPKRGLYCPDFEKAPIKPKIPFFILFECARIALESKLPLDEIISHLPENFKNYHEFWRTMEDKSKTNPIKLPRRNNSTAWIAATSNNGGVSVTGRMSFSSSGTKLFDLSLDALKFDKSCRFQRKFGGDRFFYLLVPGLFNLPTNFTDQHGHLRQRLLEWMTTDILFLGRTWRVFHTEKYKPKATEKNDNNKERKLKQTGYRLVLFATSGSDIPHSLDLSIYQLFDWFMPLRVNRNLMLPYCKAYARLDLGFSKTQPAHVFQPAQVRQVGDIMSDKSLEATEYNDPALPWPAEETEPQTMNDGCCEISLGACKEMWKALNQANMIPSAFQARINGAKGVWIRSAPTDSASPQHQDIWINVNDSQRKFYAHPEDSGASFDRSRWTFEILRSSAKPSVSSLHLAFIPILVDRGVPESSIEKLIRDVLDYERVELLDAIDNPKVFRSWLHSHALQRDRISEGLQWEAGLPVSPVEKVIFLIEHGFNPKTLNFMAWEINKIVWRYFARVVKSFSVRLSCSTYILGVADPTGSLRPGEIHLAFSEGFLDHRTQNHCQYLSKEVLVSRHPALRPSDIQKVRAVYKTQLSHLLDVVVFPSTGSIPLASKLQGGDYDGDMFWVCWEPDLVQGFSNAPAPAPSTSRLPQDFGIKVDKRTLLEMLSPRGDTSKDCLPIDNFFRNCFDFRLNDELLGHVTIFHERLSFSTNSISHPGVTALADLHDYLIDSSKNGYTYTEEDFRQYRATNPSIPIQMPPEPAYKQDIESWKDSVWKNPVSASFRRSPEKETKRRTKFNQKNILDRIHFEIIKPHIQRTLEMVEEKLSKDSTPTDFDLYNPYQQEVRSEDSEVVEELRSLKRSLQDLHREWADTIKTEGDDLFSTNPDFYFKTLRTIHAKFSALEPQNTQNPVIRRWMCNIGSSHTWWSLLKASCLASALSTKDRFIFPLAGDLLGYLKAQHSPRHRILVEDIWSMMKPKKGKIKHLELNDNTTAVLYEDHDEITMDEDEEDHDDFYSSFEYVVR